MGVSGGSHGVNAAVRFTLSITPSVANGIRHQSRIGRAADFIRHALQVGYPFDVIKTRCQMAGTARSV